MHEEAAHCFTKIQLDPERVFLQVHLEMERVSQLQAELQAVAEVCVAQFGNGFSCLCTLTWYPGTI